MTDFQIHTGDCLSILPTLQDESVHCAVTSPPYWQLRDYGHSGQIGLELTPEDFVETMVKVFRQVKRVLRNDGTLWLNLGDSYAGGGCGSRDVGRWPKQSRNDHRIANGKRVSCLATKQLIGIPWRVAFALQADGWYLRQDIIWHKPNPMPESVRDRCTKAHEYIFLLSKSPQYYYDQEAIKQPLSESSLARLSQNIESQDGSDRVPNKTNGTMKAVSNGTTRNRRSVWTVTTQPFGEAHFATFPPDLIRPCILAGCPEGGTVLDPFNGAGTTGVVCMEEGKNYTGIELNPEYVQISTRRIQQAQPQWFGAAL